MTGNENESIRYDCFRGCVVTDSEQGQDVTYRRGCCKLRDYDWPGNVRELRNICERLIVLSDGAVIDSMDLENFRVFRRESSLPAGRNADTGTKHPAAGAVPEAEAPALQREKRKAQLAKELGVSRTTLWRMEKKRKQG